MASRGKWISIKILTSLKQEIDTFCKNEKMDLQIPVNTFIMF